MATTSDDTRSLAYARCKNIDFHKYGKPYTEGILRYTFPGTIPANGNINFEVEMESQHVLDAWA